MAASRPSKGHVCPPLTRRKATYGRLTTVERPRLAAPVASAGDAVHEGDSAVQRLATVGAVEVELVLVPEARCVGGSRGSALPAETKLGGKEGETCRGTVPCRVIRSSWRRLDPR